MLRSEVGAYRIDPPPFHLQTVVSGHYAFIANTWFQASATGRLLVLDIDDPARPKLAGSFNVEGYAQYVAVSGGQAFLIENIMNPQQNLRPAKGRLHVIDISDPARLVRTATHETDTAVQGLAVSGDYCYLALQDPYAPSGRLLVLEVKDRLHPREIGSVDVRFPEGLSLAGDLLYVNRRYDGVDLFDIRNPGAPRRIGGSTLPSRGYQVAEPWFFGVAVADGYIYAPNSFAGLSILDMASRIGFSSSTVSAIEEDGSATVRVKRSGITSFLLQVEWSAKSGVDLPPIARGVIEFPAGVTEQSFTVPIIDDALDEKPETVLLQLANPTTGGLLGDATSVALIIRDGPDLVEFSSETIVVGEADGNAVMTVRRRLADKSGTLSVEISTVAGTALADQHFTPMTTKLIFGPGEISKTVSIPIRDNAVSDSDKTFEVRLENIFGGASLGVARAVVTIVDDDVRFELAKTRIEVPEAAISANIEVRRVGSTAKKARVNFSTADGTAIAGRDYTTTSGTLDFAAGETSQAITVPILNDSIIEANESFTVSLTAHNGELSVTAPGVAEVTIVDDDTFTGQPGRELNPVLVGKWPDYGRGLATTVTVSGNYAYLGSIAGLHILDITKAENPRRVGGFTVEPGSSVEAISVSGNWAFMVDRSSLKAIDVSNPASPSKIGELKFNGGAMGLALRGNYAYVADGNNGLQVIDVSDPTSLRPIANYPRPGAKKVTLSGEYAFLLLERDGLEVLDVQNPESPKKLGEFLKPGQWHNLAVVGNYAFLVNFNVSTPNAYQSDLRVLDISQPSQPKEVGSFSLPNSISLDVAIHGQYAYFAGTETLILDISDPARPKRIDGGKDILTANGAQAVAIAGNYALFPSWGGIGNGLQILDISTPSRPRHVGSYELGEMQRVVLSGQTAYVGDAKSFRIIDVTEPTNPRQLGEYTTPGVIQDVAVSGDYAFVSTGGAAGLLVFDISQPAQLKLVGQSLAGGSGAVAIHGSYAYTGGVMFNIKDPRSLKILPGDVPFLGVTRAVVSANYAYAIANGYPRAELRVVDLSDPTAPRNIGSISLDSLPMDLAVGGGYAYVETLERGLKVIDVRDPVRPKQVAVVAIQDGFGGDYAVALSGARVFLGRGASVYVLDVSDPSSPKQIGKYQETSSYFYPRALAASEDSVFVGNGFNDLRVLDLSSRIGFASPQFTTIEEEGSAKIHLKRSGVTSFPVQVEWSAKSGTATGGLDFPADARGVIEFQAGVTEQSFTIPIIDDAVEENPETILLQLSNPSPGGALGAGRTAALTINDSATTTVEFAQTAVSVGEEAGVVDLTVLRKGDRPIPFTVNIATVPGSAAPDTDYTLLNATLSFNADEQSKTIHIPILDDSVGEMDETFLLILSNPSPGTVLGLHSTNSVLIHDDDPIVHLGGTDFNTQENSGTITIPVIRERALNQEVTVDFTTRDGTARAGSDYAATSGTLAFSPGEVAKAISIPLINDGELEQPENFQIMLSNPTGGAALVSPATVNITIQADDVPTTTFNFESLTYSVNELDGSVNITVLRSGPVIGSVRVNVSTGPATATAGEDFQPVQTQLYFGQGQTKATFQIPIIEDRVAENDEAVILTLSDPSSDSGGLVALGKQNTALLMIKNAGNAVVFSQSQFFVSETNALAVVMLQRRGETNQPLSVTYATKDQSATSGSDYVARTGTLAFAAGQLTNAITIPIIDDFTAEGNETFTVMVSDPSNNVVLHPRTPSGTIEATVTILDDERVVTVDPSFFVNLTPDSVVNAVVALADGKLLLGGWFRFADEKDWTGLARLNADGSRDPGFKLDTGKAGQLANVSALEVQPDDRVNVAGSLNPSYLLSVLRLEADGALDPNFRIAQAEGYFAVSLALQSDGKVIVAGGFSQLAGAPRASIARLNTDGTLDLSFDPGTGATYTQPNNPGDPNEYRAISALRLTADGKIVIGGPFMRYNGVRRPGVARLNADGSLDASFDPGAGAVFDAPWQPLPRPSVLALEIQSDGKLVIGGNFNTVANEPRQGLARLNADGSFDRSFASQFSGANVNKLILQTDNRIIIGGDFNSINGTVRPNVARLNSDGSLHPLIALSIYIGPPTALASQADGNVIVAGGFNEVNGAPRPKLVRLFGDGAPRRSVEFSAVGYVTKENGTNVVLTLLRGGDSIEPISVTVATSDDTAQAGLDYTAFNEVVTLAPGEVGKAVTIPILDDGLVEGTESFIVTLSDPTAGVLPGLASHARVDILDNEIRATVDPSFAPDLNGAVGRVFPLPGGEYVISGNDVWSAFTQVDGVPVNRAARLLPGGSLDTSFDPGASFSLDEGNCCTSINAVQIQPDGKVLYAGYFTQFRGTRRNGLARLNSDDSLDAKFDPPEEMSGNGLALALQPDGKILVAMEASLWRLNVDGSVDSRFNRGGADCKINFITLLHGFLFHNLKLRCLSQVSPSSKWSATFSKMTGRGSLTVRRSSA